MKFVILVGSIWVVSQTLKFLVRILRGEKITFDNTLWVYQWAAGAPSTHAALLTSAVYLVGIYDSFGTLFGFSLVVAILFLYNLLAERRREQVLEGYLLASKDVSLQQAVRDGKLLDISGHNFFDIAAGIALGLLAAFVFSHSYVYL